MNVGIFCSQLWMNFWIPIPWNNRREIDAIWNLGDCGEGGVCTGMVSSVIVRLSFGSRGGIAILAPGPSQRPIFTVPMVHCSEVRRTPSYLLWCAFLQGPLLPPHPAPPVPPPPELFSTVRQHISTLYELDKTRAVWQEKLGKSRNDTFVGFLQSSCLGHVLIYFCICSLGTGCSQSYFIRIPVLTLDGVDCLLNCDDARDLRAKKCGGLGIMAPLGIVM